MEQTGTLRANRVIHRVSAEDDILSQASDVVQTDRENRIVMLKSSAAGKYLN